VASTLKDSENAIYVVYEYPNGTVHVKDAKTGKLVPTKELTDKLEE